MTLRLLLVDDSTHFLEAARMLLEREGMRVIAVASTGAEAVQRARELQPDVTLVDIDLGEESGFDVARRLTQATGALAGHVVLISAHSGSSSTPATPWGFCPSPGSQARPYAS
jgi:CheY-like chemotaxis protein